MAEQGMSEWDYQQTGSQALRHSLDLLLLSLQRTCPLKATQTMAILALMCLQAAFYCLSAVQSLSYLQSVFMLVLPAFLFNYYLMRAAGVLPYLKDPQESLTCKALAIAQVVAQACTVYVWFSSARSLLLLLATASLALFILHSLFQGSQTKLTVLGALLILGSTLYLQLTLHLPQLPSKEYAQVCAGMAVICQSYVFFSLGRLPSTCVVTVVHQVLLIELVFLPMCFQIEQIVKPCLLAWSVTVPCALLLLVGLLLLCRACQLQRDQLVTICALECYLALNLESLWACLVVSLVGLLLTQGEAGQEESLYPEERVAQLSLHLTQRDKEGGLEMGSLF